ncbi:DNA adenine methylase [Sphingobium sp.]|uniref:DNA adenine methylase n=1 Tax=Sphingobium sp. TaxID=1912891 RepID=UPI0039C9A04B
MTFLSPITPVAPAAGYQGGKRNLARRICSIIEAVDHDGYAEPFVGMGGIFLRRSARPRAEVINDISGDVATFFRVLQEHYPYFIDMLRWRVASRSEFERLLGLDPNRLTDLQRAARFLYVQRLAFGGKICGRSFGVDKVGGARFNIAKLEPALADIHDRLAGVVIEQLRYADFIRRYDRPGMLFYLDPPYWNCEGDYGADVFGKDDFAQLAELMRCGAGKFLLSINDAPAVREIFAGLAMMEIDTTYTIGSAATGAGKRVGELLISNFALV